MIRPARPDERERLREIAIAAKGHWGYDPGRVQAWGEGLDLSRAGEVYVADLDGTAVGWAALEQRGDVAWLDDLWVDPAAMRLGVGSALFRHTLERAAELGAARVEWEAEPNAVGFYERLGGRHLRPSEPSEWGRVLPVMGVDLP